MSEKNNKVMVGEVVGHISRSSSKLGSVTSIRNNNTFKDKTVPPLGTAVTLNAKVDPKFSEESRLSQLQKLQEDDDDYAGDRFENETPQLTESERAQKRNHSEYLEDESKVADSVKGSRVSPTPMDTDQK